MARVRKNSVSKDRVLWNAALYIRLSREDGNDESYSVKNQRQRLMEYLENHMFREEMRLAGVYVDDGCTGTDSDRESFQRMLEEIDQGIVNCVIVKDLSRLSRRLGMQKVPAASVCRKRCAIYLSGASEIG